MAAQVNGSWKSEFFFSASNFSAQEFDSSFTTDARSSWSDSDEVWDVVAFVDNFTDERDSITVFESSSACCPAAASHKEVISGRGCEGADEPGVVV